MEQQELRDFSRCFVVKKIAAGASINQQAEMYVVASGAVEMMTMLDDAVEGPVPLVSDKVRLGAGDASSGRTYVHKSQSKIEPVTGPPPAEAKDGGNEKKKKQKKKGKGKDKKTERSIKVTHRAGQLISTGNLEASGIMTETNAGKARQRIQKAKEKEEKDRTAGRRKSSNFRGLMAREGSLLHDLVSPKTASKEAIGPRAPESPKSSGPPLSIGRRENSADERKNKDMSDNESSDGVLSPNAPKKKTKFSFKSILNSPMSDKNSDGEGMDAGGSLRFSLGKLTFGSGRSNAGASETGDSIWSIGAKFASRGKTSGKEKVRGVMKLTALEDTTILFLDRGRRRKFLKRYPDLQDIIDTLMHAKIDNFLSQLPFLSTEDDEHEGLGMLSSVCKYEAFEKGEPIFVEGEVGDKLYIILKGKCAVLKNEYADKKSVNPKNQMKDVNSPIEDTGIPGSVSSEVLSGGNPGSGITRRKSFLGGAPKSGSKKNISRGERSMKEEKDGSQKANLSVVKGGINKVMNKFRHSKNGKTTVLEYREEDVLASLPAGNYFGEMAVMVTMPRSSTVVAEEKSLLLTVSKKEWQHFLSYHETTKARVERHMKTRLMGLFRSMNISFFESVPRTRYDELAEHCDVLDLPSGHTIMRQGDRGDLFYIIIHGEVDVDVQAGVGGADAPKAKWNGKLSSGQYFGEVALVMDSPRKATVVTSEDTVLLGINQATFNLFFEGNPRALAEIQIRLLGERAELHSILALPSTLSIFKEFLLAEHSEENIVFWERARDFENAAAAEDTSYEKVKALEERREIPQFLEVQEIWDKYLSEGSELQVNISSKMRLEVQRLIMIVQKWVEGADVVADGVGTKAELIKATTMVRTRAIFKDSREEIYKLMVRDSYSRFKKFDKYLDFMVRLGLYSTANSDNMSRKMATLKGAGTEGRGAQGGKGKRSKSGAAFMTGLGMGMMGAAGTVGNKARMMADRAGSVRIK